MVSANKGTPGIEFTIVLKQRKYQNTWEEIDWRERRVWLYFAPGGDHSWNMKKLAFAGHSGGGLTTMDLRGKTAEVIGSNETHEGKEREKFELALPGGFSRSEPSDDAFLAIDAILQSSTVPGDVKPAALEETTGRAVDRPAAVTPGAVAERQAVPPTSLPDDEIPF